MAKSLPLHGMPLKVFPFFLMHFIKKKSIYSTVVYVRCTLKEARPPHIAPAYASSRCSLTSSSALRLTVAFDGRPLNARSTSSSRCVSPAGIFTLRSCVRYRLSSALLIALILAVY